MALNSRAWTTRGSKKASSSWVCACEDAWRVCGRRAARKDATTTEKLKVAGKMASMTRESKKKELVMVSKTME